MKIYAVVASIFYPILYILGYPFLYVLGKYDGDFIRHAIYMIARCKGYSRTNAELLVKQSNLETGYQVKGRGLMEANNLFGMKMPKIRDTLATDTTQLAEGTFAKFPTIYHSILDRIMWDEYNSINKVAAEGNYMILVLKKRYAEDRNYPNKWASTETRMNPDTGKVVTGFYTGLSLILVGWFIYKKKR